MMLTGLKDFWKDVQTPSGAQESPHYWAAIAAGHYLIGAAVIAVFPVQPWAVLSVYFVLKELRDYKRGGRPLDGAIDTGFVGLGAYGLPAVAVGAIALGVALYRWVRSF